MPRNTTEILPIRDASTIFGRRPVRTSIHAGSRYNIAVTFSALQHRHCDTNHFGVSLAKLYFRFAAMNAGKSTSLLQVAHNYGERDQTVDLYTAEVDNRYGEGNITSRLGVTRDSFTFTDKTDFEAIYRERARPNCILIDEAQFLSEAQVIQLHRMAHTSTTPVICYGL